THAVAAKNTISVEAWLFAARLYPQVSTKRPSQLHIFSSISAPNKSIGFPHHKILISPTRYTNGYGVIQQ
ncbi:hypothetical protein J0J30_22350, partial [Vibrio vulnificus]|nr:hypothetical protein [Vibrio vulnificus]